jgi:hypothetical protein
MHKSLLKKLMFPFHHHTSAIVFYGHIIRYMMFINMEFVGRKPSLHPPSDPHRSMSIASSPHPASLVAGVYAAWSIEHGAVQASGM